MISFKVAQSYVEVAAWDDMLLDNTWMAGVGFQWFLWLPSNLGYLMIF